MIIDFVYSLLALVSAINCLGVVVRDICSLAGLRDRVAFFVNQSDEFSSLIVGDLDILPYHSSFILINIKSQV